MATHLPSVSCDPVGSFPCSSRYALSISNRSSHGKVSPFCWSKTNPTFASFLSRSAVR